MVELTRKQIAELRGCIPGTVSNAHLPKTKGKTYDLLDPEVWGFVTEPTVKDAIYEYKRTMMEEYEDEENSDLDDQKKKTYIEWKKKQMRKLDLEHAKDKNDLIPSDLIGIWIGYFASGLRNNFLTIAARVARNNKPLRNKIEKEITKAIKKTLSTAAKELKKYSEKIVEGMEE